MSICQKTLQVFIFTAILVTSATSFAGRGITYHGRILKPNGTAVEGQFVGFRLRLMEGDTGTCEMYQEIQTKDMRNSAGVFSIIFGDGSVVGSYNVTGLTYFDELFQNGKTFNFSSPAGCIATPYVAGARDGRKLAVEFREAPGDPWEAMPIMDIAHVPFAYGSLVSQKVGNHGDGSLLRVENAGVPQNIPALTPTQYSELFDLVDGDSTQYVQSVLGTASQITVNTAAGVATVGLADVATAGTYGSATQVPVFVLDAKGRITSVTNTTITGAAPTGVAGGDLTGNYPNPDIAANAVGTTEIAALAVTDAKLAADAVTTTKILDANVTLDKLATNSVNSAKIVDGSIVGADISSTAALSVASVTATGAVTSDSVSTRSMGLFELPVNGTNYVALKAPDLLAGNTTYTWPAAAPGSNMVLQSDATGQLSWVAASTGSVTGTGTANQLAKFTASGVIGDSTVTELSGNVGIGIAAPTMRFHVRGDASMTSGSHWVSRVADSGNSGVLDLGYLADGTNVTAMRIKAGGSVPLHLGTSSNLAQVTILDNGNVGIGNTAPTSKLNVTDGRIAVGGAGGYLQLGQDSSDNNLAKLSMHPSNSQSTDQYFIGLLHNNSAGWMALGGGTSLNLNLDSGSTASYGSHVFRKTGWNGTNRTYTEAMRIDPNSNVGIGTADPKQGYSGLASAARYLGIAGDGTANAASAGRIFLSNNRATPAAADNTGILLFGSVNNSSTEAHKLTSSIGGFLEGSGGSNGFGGYLTFSTKTDNAAIGERMRITGAGNVGIGTTTPSAKLEVAGTIKATAFDGPMTSSSTGTPGAYTINTDTDNNGSDGGVNIQTNAATVAQFTATGIMLAGTGGASTPALSFMADPDTGVRNPSANTISLMAGGTDRLYIDALGNVGIGTTSPNTISANANSKVLTISGDGTITNGRGVLELSNPRASGSIAAGNQAGSIFFSMPNNQVQGLGVIQALTEGAGGANGFGGSLYFHTKTDNVVGAAVKMVLNNAGNVGVGTTSPSSRLHLYSSGTSTTLGQLDTALTIETHTTTANAGNEIRFRGHGGATDPENVYASIAAPVSANSSGAVGYLSFATKALSTDTSLSERMRITGAGNVGIGTTAPTGGLHVLKGATGAESKFYFQNGTTAANGSATIGLYPNDTTIRGAEIQALATVPNITDLVFKTNASGAAPAERVRIASSGNVGIGAINPLGRLHVENAVNAFPTNSGTTDTAIALRLGANSSGTNLVLDSGIKSGASGGAWIQSRNSSDLSANFNLFLNPNGGNVGIGTTTPSAKLDVAGTIKATAFDGPMTSSSNGTPAAYTINTDTDNAGGDGGVNIQTNGSNVAQFTATGIMLSGTGGASTPALSFMADPDTGVRNPAANAVSLMTGGTDRLYIDSSGNVGIGTTTPIAKLNVEKSAALPNATVSDPGNYIESAAFRIHSGNNGLSLGVDNVLNSRISWIQSGHRDSAFAGASSTLALQPLLGNVGVGTTTPTNKLHVYDASHAYLKIEAGASARQANLIMKNADQQWSMGVGTNNHFSIFDNTATADRFHIDNSGYVGIGTTAPARKLDVYANSGSTSVAAFRTNDFVTGSAGSAFGFNFGAASGNTYSEIRALSNGGSSWNNLILQQTGNVGIGTTNPLAKLQVSPAAAGTVAIFGYSGGTNNPYISMATDETNSLSTITGNATAGNGALAFATSSSFERMRITSAGNVGIGTTAPAYKVHVAGELFDASTVMTTRYGAHSSGAGHWTIKNRGTSTTNYAPVLLNDQMGSFGASGHFDATSSISTGAYMAVLAGGDWSSGNTPANLSFLTNSGNSVSEKMRVTASGNVGVGTTTPATKLDVSGQVKAAMGTPLTNPASNNIDFITGNTQFVTFSSCPGNALTANLFSMHEGGSYSLVVVAPSGCVVTFTGTNAIIGAGGGTAVASFKQPGGMNYSSTGEPMIFSFLRANNIGFVSQVVDFK